MRADILEDSSRRVPEYHPCVEFPALPHSLTRLDQPNNFRPSSLDGLPCGFPKSFYLTVGFAADFLVLILVAAAVAVTAAAGRIEGV